MFTGTRCPAARGARVQVGATTPALSQEAPASHRSAQADVAATQPLRGDQGICISISRSFFKKGKHTNILRCSGTTAEKFLDYYFQKTQYGHTGHRGENIDGLCGHSDKLDFQISAWLQGGDITIGNLIHLSTLTDCQSNFPTGSTLCPNKPHVETPTWGKQE